MKLITRWFWGIFQAFTRFFRGFQLGSSTCGCVNCFQTFGFCHSCAGFLLSSHFAPSPRRLVTAMPRWVFYFSSRNRGERSFTTVSTLLLTRKHGKLITNTTINSVVKALTLQYRQPKTGFLLLAWSETRKSRTLYKQKIQPM